MALWEYEYKDGTVKVDCLGSIYGASVEDEEQVMSRIIDILMEVKKAETIILSQSRDFEYDFEQTQLLAEVAFAIRRLMQDMKILRLGNLEVQGCTKHTSQRLAFLQKLITSDMKKDPIGAYVELIREYRILRAKAKYLQELDLQCTEHYMNNALVPVKRALESTKIVRLALPFLEGHHVGSREIYRNFFHPVIRPNFMLTRYMMVPPKNGELIDRYALKDVEAEVEIFNVPDSVQKVYHITPPEFKLTEEEYTLLDIAREYMAAHKPSKAEFAEPEKIRETFFNIGKDMLSEIADSMGIILEGKKLNLLAKILTRYTAGYGILEILLADPKIQDIYVNSPIGQSQIYLFHEGFEECTTNIIPTKEDAQAWATRFRIESGRPLDEANPVLDADITVPGGKARIAAITKSLSPEGLAFAFRRHREKPWTFPLFINQKAMTPLAAGLLSFIIDGARSVLIAGTRSSGKTSLLGATITEIMKKVRVVSVEDSVTGDASIIYEKGGKLHESTIAELIDHQIVKYGGIKTMSGHQMLDENPEGIKVFSMDKRGKIKTSAVKQFIRHNVKKDIYKIRTRTGRELKVTQDHSLFALDDNANVSPILTHMLKKGMHLAVPKKLTTADIKHITSINLLEKIDEFKQIEVFVQNPEIGNAINENKEFVQKLAQQNGYLTEGRSKGAIQYWKRNNTLPSKIYLKLKEKNIKLDPATTELKTLRQSFKIPAILPVDDVFLEFLGLWLGDGCYDKRSVIISIVDEHSRSVVRNIASRLNIPVKMHSDGISLMLNSKLLKCTMSEILGFKGNAYTKTIPQWAFSLSDEQTAPLIRGIYSADGYLAKSEIGISLCSKKLIGQLQTLFLRYGIISRINNMVQKDKTVSLRISTLNDIRKFVEGIGFLQDNRMEKLVAYCKKKSTHSITDIIPLSIKAKIALSKITKRFNNNDYIARGNQIGTAKLSQLLSTAMNTELVNKLNLLLNSDIFWDEIDAIEKVNYDGFVYDLSVPENENFICSNFIAHNTLELPMPELKALGYNIERLKSRSVITHVESELSTDEAIRTSLRLGDSALILGEVRSTEAKALYEAMRIGALANVVAGTIHGESPYGVFDRVVNDLGVPPTSFKATDIIVIANRLRSADGLHTYRRIIEITEVRKDWKSDPKDEKGFVPLMVYNSKTDQLEPTETLLNGESETLNEIGKKVKDWRDNWNAIWSNIQLRAKIKQAIVEYAAKNNKPSLLEAPFVIEANDQFHIISERVKSEYGVLDTDRIFARWEEWAKNRIAK